MAWHAALMRPDQFRGVIGLSVPFRPRGPVRPSSVMPQTADAIFYQLYFQPPGVAEADLEHDVRASIRSVLLSIAGEAPAGPGGSPVADNFSVIPRDGELRGRIARDAREAVPLPGWVTEADIDFYAGEFSRAGFRGGLNWYRNIHRNWELLSPFAGARADFILRCISRVSATSFLVSLVRRIFSPICRGSCLSFARMLLPGCGHWTQQERPREVNEAMISFLKSL